MSNITLTYRELPTYSLAAQQNAYRLFTDLKLSYITQKKEDDQNIETPFVHRNLKVTLKCEGDYIQPEIWEISQISTGERITLQDRKIQLSHDFLFNLSDEIKIKFEFIVNSLESDEPLLRISDTLRILPANFWGGESRQPELLAAFVKPNGHYVESLVKKATEVLEKNGHQRSADGYQSNSREKPYMMAAALWGVILRERISYVAPPPSYAHNGQLIRLTSEISTNKIGACLDLSLLFASCLELMGLNTIVALTNNHAFVGVWLIDSCFPLLTNDDPMELRKRVDGMDVVFFETTMVTNSHAPTFKQACDHARSLIAEESEGDFVYAIDITQARLRKIKPLATIEERPEEQESNEDSIILLPSPPPLPPVRSSERIIEETPETRIDTWQRKLLDLTKRNPLLSFKERTAGIRVYCPDIGKLEDLLADGITFKFISAEESPINDRDRSPENFRLTTGTDLHENYALEQLDRATLVANMGSKKLESTLITLLRKAKNDLQEGGANTLFLSVGMLSWKENPEDTRSFKAPLILIPVELNRKGARSKIKLSQIHDEEPIFNLSLIEFLNTEYNINLNHFREDLPEDSSGLDVSLIWQGVREAIAEESGFEVIEECVIASFSFSKYLMWKDLKDRIEDLKQNLFVKHLVENPTENYSQNSEFYSRDEIDQRISPTDIFIPLNADSSQIVAIEASTKAQDFVLEGPPGTGKSETIANIIANNLAKGRKVLFVAEKIAALKVVYRRLEKIHLDQFCLELHSNKANKKAVLDQLRRATESREQETNKRWSKNASLLKKKRDELNEFVKELHQPTDFGISPRQAISQIAGSSRGQKVEFNWKGNLTDCPIEGEDGLNAMLEASEKAALAFSDASHIDPSSFDLISAQNWSFLWQENFINNSQLFIDLAEKLTDQSTALANSFNISDVELTVENIEQIAALSELITIALEEPIDLAIGKNVKERLQNLGDLADKKQILDQLLKDIAHGASVSRIENTPIDDWLKIFEESQKSWIKRLIAQIKIHKAAKAVGFEKFKSLDVLYKIKHAKNTLERINPLIKEFTDFKIWSGWESKPEQLVAKKETATKAHGLIQYAINLSDDPIDIISAIKSKLVDGRDYLETSKLVGTKNSFDKLRGQWWELKPQLSDIGIKIDTNTRIAQHSTKLKTVIENKTDIKPWVEWVSAKDELLQFAIEPLGIALEAGLISPDEAQAQTYTAFCNWLTPRVIDERNSLREFKASQHNKKIIDFRELDEELASTTSSHISSLLSKGIPDIKSKENSTHFGTLARELQKKTRHKPIRQLFDDMGERLLDLTPCLMMSPLSVSQFLPSNFNAFDLVVFDEASQITTWESVGAIARGKNVIVVGDPKQMPPTNFFNTSVDPDDPDEEDMESILDQALAAGLPHLRLMGHYRSKHETLIAFSNSKYYENALVTYPSSETKESAVIFHRVNGVYAKGKGRNNPIEAQAVADEVVRRLKDPELRKQSLGVVTLNTEQQRTIEDLLDDARRKHVEIETYFQATDNHDPVFIKNLESVQGDERDVILFSLGYGPTEPEGKTMSMNFGPLNKQGGERRLNVAITRATTEVVVFASFDSGMIDLSRTSATAVEHLKHYLEFAEKGTIALAEQSTAAHGVDQFDSDFEQSVAFDLRELGWKIQTQVGVSKFRVDLGIIDPDHCGRYLAGVECDGATYHNSPSARDRDRTRQDILENLGWQLVRLWSTDYFRDPKGAIKIVHDRLNGLLNDSRRKPNK